MAQRSNNPRMTIWTWPRGLYPGQMHFYFKAKALPRHALASPDNPDGALTIVPIAVDPKIIRLAPVYVMG
ncbi:hypothetical protein AA0113_g12765 [Alternaria arborescens]|uniref:Uncharacterized protein n=3 Tax=Alternaria sect. Alternaria TaxID=2499237 RepID=A0A4Q4MX63_ALTAL|nr:hypothetical protein AA0112_g12723 [Alternaria arborescens]RYN16038.1 hypothetical protein AA0114_g13022 [Alternaria tenuissima]RYN60392.1 hypothetical protein AA0117_g13053 [Alternaria alternata]RYO22654.1 hypothetical protein AA0113_g12765 [Alternaria arborescens]